MHCRWSKGYMSERVNENGFKTNIKGRWLQRKLSLKDENLNTKTNIEQLYLTKLFSAKADYGNTHPTLLSINATKCWYLFLWVILKTKCAGGVLYYLWNIFLILVKPCLSKKSYLPKHFIVLMIHITSIYACKYKKFNKKY